jgi:hypothetical protein
MRQFMDRYVVWYWVDPGVDGRIILRWIFSSGLARRGFGVQKPRPKARNF